MIGPVGENRNIFVTWCGQQVSTYNDGLLHERTCLTCDSMIFDMEAESAKVVSHPTVKNNNIPMLIWPDGSHTHIEPNNSEQLLMKWLDAWMDS